MEDSKIVEAIIELKTEVKIFGKTLGKVEKVLENQGVYEEKQSVANKRILDLEKSDEKIETRVRKLEDWQIKIIAIATTIATIFGFILNKVF